MKLEAVLKYQEIEAGEVVYHDTVEGAREAYITESRHIFGAGWDYNGEEEEDYCPTPVWVLVKNVDGASELVGEVSDESTVKYLEQHGVLKITEDL